MHLSLSARRAWIEMTYVIRLPRCQVVALRKESVDRNGYRVAKYRQIPPVALRKESVDRNCEGGVSFAKNYKSLSARRAWIEINTGATKHDQATVALRKESVDRNTSPHSISSMILTSLSARRAWIEILCRLT